MESIKHRVSNQTYTFVTPAADAPIEVLNEFYWTKEAEPHVLRRKQILAKYPEVAKLTGYETKTKWYVLGVVLLQFLVAYYLRDTSPLAWKFMALAYIIGATSNQALFLAIHELSHNLLFKKPLHNKIFAIFANLPIGVPYSASFQPYHQLHHKFMGDHYLDTDLPTKFEAMFLSNLLGKVLFATFQIFFYALRPMFITQIQFTYIHLLNIVVQIATDYVMVQSWGWNALAYFIMSSFLAGSLHPCAGHFIAEHYVLNENNKPRQERKDGITISKELLPAETYSYYGSLNLLTWNVGYHNEHHDFPYIAWTKLPQLREIASEFYDPLPQVTSWCGVIWCFMFNDVNTLWNRVRRTGKERHGSRIRNLDQNQS
ncbi:fatty acid desaturase (DSD1) [Scheffersomyces stipitis CBS 6054]|uniref:Sphingolipid delta(4)-desaturase n=1 Tax=Scheffersomyces stipitis (strain ATCC 58785 / CBS 6054 / NBRC 10063 / NRRL Y-11545) TaxID=322104 RepID=A3LQP8_PICST|nr:fatty acid desaturase (DSD1) [Scheffersomyces stipitis CBS 6054]ABN64723.1 fatty acid desaturase (DSD1) [Scheffersomyces stipitis CBS 6054]